MHDIKGNVVNIQVSGPASAMKAKKLAEPRKIMLGGDLTGSVEFDGSQDVVLEAKVLNAQETAKPDYSQNDEAQPDYIKHRPGGYDVVTPGVTIQWDGVIGDRTVLTIVNDDIFRDVKISDVVLTKEMLIGATADGAEVQEGHLTDGDGYVSLAMGSKQILSFSKTGSVDVNGFEHRVTETGTYAYVPSMDPVPSNLYIAELVTANVVKPVQIPATYLDLATPDYYQNDATQPDYIKNRPGGYYQTVPAINIQWDGVVGDKPNAVIGGNIVVKVSDEILTAEQIIGATAVMVRGAESKSMILSEDQIMSGDGFVMETRGAIISCSKTTFEIDGLPLTFPETGTYFISVEEDGYKMYVSSLTKPEKQELVPIPGELTNIKGGYDLPAISNQPVYSGTVPSSAFSVSTQAEQGRRIAVAVVVEQNYGAPITLANPLAEGATVSGTVNGMAVSGVVEKDSAGSLNAALYTTGASARVAVMVAGGSSGTLVCTLTSDAVMVSGNPPETDMVLALSQSREAMPKVIPAEYLDVDLSAVQNQINEMQMAMNDMPAKTNPVFRGSFSQNRAVGTVIGDDSHVEGLNCTASGLRSHAEGLGCQATNEDAHAEGNGCTASGVRSHAEGVECIAAGQDQHVQGRCNIEDDANKYAHIVGNGLNYTNRSNAHTLDWSGVPWYQGRPQFGGTAQDNGSQTVMANGDKELILVSSTVGSTKKFKITVDDTGTLSATEVTT